MVKYVLYFLRWVSVFFYKAPDERATLFAPVNVERYIIAGIRFKVLEIKPVAFIFVLYPFHFLINFKYVHR